MIVTRSGLHFPKPEWAKWRNAQVVLIKSQLPKGFQPIDKECFVNMVYFAGDKRRRDFPAICDAIWHVLEKARVVTDDTLLWPTYSVRGYDKENPRCELAISTQ